MAVKKRHILKASLKDAILYREEHSRSEIVVYHALRMNWLRWLGTPIIAIWRFVVWIFIYVCKVVLIAWQGMKEAWNLKYCVIASIGNAISFFLILLFIYIAGLTESQYIALLGFALAFLPVAWSYGEIASMIKQKEDEHRPIHFRDHKFKYGFKVVGYIGLYVVVICLLVVLQFLLNSLSFVPKAGMSFFGILILPNIVISFLIFCFSLILALGLLFLPSHLLYQSQVEGHFPRRFIARSYSLLKLLAVRSKWVKVIVLFVPAIVLSLISSIPLFVFLLASFSISGGISATVHLSHNMNSGIGYELSRIGDSFFRLITDNTYFLTDFIRDINSLSFEYKISLIFVMLSISVIAGIAASLHSANIAASYYYLYKADD